MKLWSMIKEWWRKMISPKTIEDKFKLVPAISTVMEEAIERWNVIYMDRPLFDIDNKPLDSLNLGYKIASEKARTACLELKTEVYDPKVKDTQQEEASVDVNTRAYFLDSQYQKLIKTLRHKITPGVALGTMVIKPIPDPGAKKIYFEYVLAHEFFPITFNLDGKLTQAVFIERIVKKDVVYTKLETHSLKNGTITVKQEAFVENSSDSIATETLGQPIPLANVAEWQNLQPQVQIVSSNNVKLDRLLVACLLMPETNNLDPHSPLGMSAFAPAERLIVDAYEIYSQLMWEYEGCQLAIDAPRNALKAKMDKNGEIIEMLPKRQERLFRQVDISTAGGDDLYKVFSPQIRDVSFLNGLNSILVQIEDAVALSRGTLSQVEAEARTATEIKSLKQRTYQSNHDLQQALQGVLEDVVYIMNVYATIYNMAPQGEYETSFEWDDSVLVDVAEELRQRSALAAAGSMEKVEVGAWYLGQTVEKRLQDIQKIKELEKEYNPQPELEMATNIFKG